MIKNQNYILRIIRDCRYHSKDMTRKDFKGWIVMFLGSIPQCEHLSNKDRLNLVNIALKESILL